MLKISFLPSIKECLKAKQDGRELGQTAMYSLLVAIAIFALFMLPVGEAFSNAQAFYSKLETQNRLSDIAGAVTNAYTANTKLVESQTGAVLALPLGTLSPVAPQVLSGGTRMCLSNSTTLTPLATYTNLSTSIVYKDGYGKPMCFLISSQLSTTTSGQTIYYHNIAIISAGRDGSIAPSTALTASGALVTGGDDQGRLIDGSSINSGQMAITLARMNALVSALQSYFYGRYQSNSNRDPSLDYFTNASDTVGIIPDTGGVPILATNANLLAALGLSGQALQDGWGNVFTFDNSSSLVRNPSNPNGVAYTNAPYTSQICTTLPGGQSLCLSALGSY